MWLIHRLHYRLECVLHSWHGKESIVRDIASHSMVLLKSLEKSLDVLDIFLECNKEMSLNAIANRAKLNISTTFRIVSTLERRQYLQRDPIYRKYKLGPKALALGYSSHWTENIVTLARPYLYRLQQDFNETASIYVAEGDSRICLDFVESSRSLRRVIPAGESLPIYKGAAGKVLLAWSTEEVQQRICEDYGVVTLADLNVIRHNGYAVTQDESEHGLFAISVPVFNFNSTIAAALTIAGPTMRFYESVRQKMLFALNQYAGELSHLLGHQRGI